MPAFFTLEDTKIAFSLFCCVYGVGTLGMPANYARAGYGWASLALVFMAAVNIYASLCISKVLLQAPKTVRTYGDLGAYCMGSFGRWAVVISHMLTCILVPIAFLVLGGIMLTTLFPDAYGMSTWIVLMGLMLLPVCLTPTLKEGAMAAAAGCLGTLVADGVALYLLVDNMTPIADGLSTPPPNLSFKQIATVFGNLALAYNAGIIIPSLQREHSDPTRMPRVIYVTLGVISVCFLVVAITGVSVVGCQIPGNLLFAIASTKLGFKAHRGGVILAFLFMQLHVTIAFAVTIFPAFYTMERLVLGIHKVSEPAQEPAAELEVGSAHFVNVSTPPVKPNEDEAHEHDDVDAHTYQQPGVYPRVAALRIVVIVACVFISIAWEDRLLDLLDFTGASCIALCSMILPMVFYLKHFGAQVGLLERLWAYIAILVSLFLGVYVSYLSAGPLFNPPPAAPTPAPWDAPKFPFCSGSYVNMVYTNVSYHQAFGL